MAGQQTLSVKITGDASNLKAEVNGAKVAIDGLGGSAKATAGASANLGKATLEQATAHRAATAQANQQSFAMRQLGVQSIQAFSGIATGMPVMTVLIQQGHQVLDVALSTGQGFGMLRAAGEKLGGALMSVVSPIGLTVAGLALLGGGAFLAIARSIELEAQQRALSVALRGTGRDAVASTTQMQGYIKALERQGVDSATASEEVLKLARTQGLSGEAIKGVISLSGDLAASLGTDVPTAIQKLVDAFTGGYDGAKKLDDALNYLSAGQRDQIRSLLESGNAAGAVRMQVSALSTTIKGMRDASLTDATKAFEEMKNSWGEFVDSMARSSVVVAAMKAVAAAIKPPSIGMPSDGPGQIAYLQNMLAAGANMNPDVPAVSGRARTNMEIDVARLQLAAARQQGPPAPDAAGTKETERLGKVTADLTRDYKDQIVAMSAALPVRAQVIAQQQAERIIAGQNIDAAHAAIIVQEAKKAAMASEAAARRDELLGMNLETASAIELAKAVSAGRVAMMQTAAATEAYSKSQTQGGVDVEAFTQAILNRNAAQILAQGANQAVELEETAKAARDLADATAKGFAPEHAAELAENIRQITVRLREAAAAAPSAEVAAQLNGIADRSGASLRAIDASTQSRTLSKMGLTQDQELETLATRGRLAGAGWQQRDSELADLKAKQDIERKGLDINDQAAVRYRAQARAIAMTTQEVQAQEAAWQAVGDIGKQAFSAIGQQITDDISRGALGFKTLEKVGLQVANTLIQKFAELAIINPLLNSLGLGGSKLPVIGDVLGGITGLFGGGSAAPINWPVGVMHSGGAVGFAGDMRDVPASIFAGARRFHGGGGVGASEMPIIAELGEHVLTAKQGAAIAGSLGGVNQTINFHGNAGSDQDRRQLAAMVRQAADAAVSARAPGIAAAAQAGIINAAGRGGRAAQQLGRR